MQKSEENYNSTSCYHVGQKDGKITVPFTILVNVVVVEEL